MKPRFDTFWLGLIIGMTAPILTTLIFFSSKCGSYSLMDCLEYSRFKQVLSQVLSLCALPNLGIFFLFIWRNHYLSARGVLIATIIWATFVLGIKIFT